MLIGSVLQEKGGQAFTIAPGLTLAEAVDELHRRRVGAVLVTESGAIVGVFSERDLVREIARRGAAALSDSVASAMTRAVVTVTLNDTLDNALARMTDRRIRHLPVLDDGRLVGVVSIGDLVKAKIAQAEAEAEAMRTYITAG